MESRGGKKIVGASARTSLRLGLLFTVLCAHYGDALPVITDTGAMRYLSQFGYLPPTNPTSGGIITEEAMSNAISEFQSFAGLNVTGTLDSETASLMATPRCGVKDKIGQSDGRSKRYVLQGSRWRTKQLTYSISNYPPGLKHADVDANIEKAFGVWSAYTDLSFHKKPRNAQVHIAISFASGEHGDGDPFDGPGGTLAHAYFPAFGGDAHFDEAEHWTVNNLKGTNLFQVAAHEFGHSLGLSHSDVKAAVMAPFYKPFNFDYDIESDDIQAIQALYGPKTTVKPDTGVRRVTTPAPTNEEDPELCTNTKVDAMFNSAEGHTYVFKGDHYWKLTADGVESGYPRLISATWKGLPGNIDTAFTYKNGKTYFFKGSKYWRYVGRRMDGDYPREISEGFTGIPDDIDAAMVWTGNGKIYFYKGTKFWRFDPAQRPPVRSTYPKLISNWEGLPDNIDTALSYHGYTYFFKNDAYYRFNDRTFSVDVADPAFPRASGYWWFGCRSANKGTLGNVHWRRGYPFDNSFGYGNLEDPGNAKTDNDDDDNHYEVDDIILDAGDTDEQLVTSLNQDVGNYGNEGGALIGRNHRYWSLSMSLLSLSLARYLVAT